MGDWQANRTNKDPNEPAVSPLEAVRRAFSHLPGPVVIFNKSHSGSRLLAELVEEAGVFMGAHQNESRDSLDLVELVQHLVLTYYPDYSAPLGRPGRRRRRASPAGPGCRRAASSGTAGGPGLGVEALRDRLHPSRGRLPFSGSPLYPPHPGRPRRRVLRSPRPGQTVLAQDLFQYRPDPDAGGVCP